ncbi:conserved hypothetical protein [Histoplasma capsulatum H143]|uniref:Uncharacterized protein n=1 Tax=Ajellomyces capsulatus (strain H143) TaxID=544712 RepID=C6HL25_AJECH|nr:conserved hypothetical protein [Histoplasma capsulatum H143]
MRISIIATGLLLAAASTADAWNIQLKSSGGKKLKMHGRDFKSGKCINLNKAFSAESISFNHATSWAPDPNGVYFCSGRGCEYNNAWLSDKVKRRSWKKSKTVRAYQITKGRPSKRNIDRANVDDFEDFEDFEDFDGLGDGDLDDRDDGDDLDDGDDGEDGDHDQE